MTALMNKFGSWFLLLLILGLTEPFQVGVAHGQTAACKGEIEDSTASSVVDPCVDPSTHPALKEAMQFLCLRPRLEFASCSAPKAIVVGFVGGFVKPNDVKHPEVVFAHYLRSRYGSAIHTEMFGNHDAKGAAEHLADWLNASGLRTSIEKKDIKIILYGHSWGASEVLAFARELQRREIPVSLTIQIDSVRKLHQNDRTVPTNVEKAVNFYQTHGLTPGQKLIVPADPTRTRILGNYRMTYQDHQIRCDNYKWLSRAFNKPHHQIENDPHVWDQVGLLIDSELTDARTAPTPSSTDFDEDTVARSQNDKK